MGTRATDSVNRELAFSVTVEDCDVQTFRAGGPGGQKQNKTNSGVRIIHPPSGARGESREHRTQLENKRAAFLRMAESREFQMWARVMALKLEPIDAIVDRAMEEDNIKIEVKEGGQWVESSIVSLLIEST